MTSCIVCCDAAATVFCCQDDASLCAACSSKIHSANLVAARHTIVPFCALCNAAPSTVFCRNDDAFLCAACDSEAHVGPLACRHERVPAASAVKETTAAQVLNKAAEEVFGETSSGANSEVFGACDKQEPEPTELGSLGSLGADFGVVPVLQVAEEPKDDLMMKPWGKDFESLDIDSSWLDRLYMGFDFSDILAEPSAHHHISDDDAGLVPTISGSFIKCEEADVVPQFLPVEDEEEQHAAAAVASASEDVMLEEPCSSGRKRKAGRRSQLDDEEYELEQDLLEAEEEEDEEEEEEELSDDDDYRVPAFKPRKQQRIMSTAPRRAVSSSALGSSQAQQQLCGRDDVCYQMPAATVAVSAVQAAINRAQRVLKCREKRKSRKYEKTIRYATRKAYAEVRPRIKGRFVKKEELEAYRAKYGASMTIDEQGVVTLPDM